MRACVVESFISGLRDMPTKQVENEPERTAAEVAERARETARRMMVGRSHAPSLANRSVVSDSASARGENDPNG